MTRPRLNTFRVCGDTYYGLRAESESPDFARPVLRVPAEVAHLVKVEWPKPSGYAQKAMRASSRS